MIGGVPKDEAYSRVSDPERYRPLHRRADLLVQRLDSVYDAVVTDDTLDRAERAVRVAPADPDAAPVTIGWTDFPGLVVRFGEHCDRAYPHCGCNACDEDPGEVFAEFERDVYAVTTGRFREWPGGWEFEYPDGRQSAGHPGEPVREWARWPRFPEPGAFGTRAVFSSVQHGLNAEAVVREHLAAFNAHDTARLFDWFAPDCVWVTGTDRAEGTAALRDLFDDWLWSLDPSLAVESLVADGGEHVAAQLTERLTVDGTLRTFPIAAFFTVRDGRITHAKVYREGSADV